MRSRLAPSNIISLVIAGLAGILAIVGAVWVIVPIQAGPFHYRESILAIDGLGVLPLLLAPFVLVLAGSAALFMWMLLRSTSAKWVAWLVAMGFLAASLVSMGIGPFFLPAALSLILAVAVQDVSSRRMSV